MENFELIESYVRGKLAGQEKLAFENQLQRNKTLQREVELQKELVKGIKNARTAQLKTMLNQVPVTTVSQVNSYIKYFAAGAVTSAIVVSGLFYYFEPFQNTAIVVETKNEKPIIESKLTIDSSYVKNEEAKPEIKKEVIEAKKNVNTQTVASAVNKKSRPKIQVTDPTDELTTSPAKQEKSEPKEEGKITTSDVKVEINDANSDYKFHYQFNQSHLILYGKFDDGLYEIIEVNGSARSMFLYYKDYYYLLDEKQTSVTPLIPINNLQLIRKLKEYRK